MTPEKIILTTIFCFFICLWIFVRLYVHFNRVKPREKNLPGFKNPPPPPKGQSKAKEMYCKVCECDTLFIKVWNDKKGAVIPKVLQCIDCRTHKLIT